MLHTKKSTNDTVSSYPSEESEIANGFPEVDAGQFYVFFVVVKGRLNFRRLLFLS